MTFHRINEDPTYDDDGNCVDEDYIDPAEWDKAFPKEKPEDCYIIDCDPYGTVNS